MSPSPCSVMLMSKALYIGSSDSRHPSPLKVDFELAQGSDGAYSLRWRSTENASSAAPKSASLSFSLKKKPKQPLSDVVLSMDSVFGATCAREVPPSGNASLASSSVIGVSSSTPTNILLIHTLEYSNDAAERYKKGYRYVFHAFETEGGDAGDWARTICCLARGEAAPDLSQPMVKARVLVVINPFAGTRSAPKVFRETVRPMLELAGFAVDERDTEYGGHANEIVSGLPASDLYLSSDSGTGSAKPPYSRLISVSGDGVLHELIQGLFSRPDWHLILPCLKLGIVSGGSANALARNIGEGSSVLGSIRGIISGRTTPLSLMAMTQHGKEGEGRKTWFSHLELLWGFPADADIESERRRWAGYGEYVRACERAKENEVLTMASV
jgi:hypothetical protein